MRVLVSGGGTAGHVNPALAIAYTIKKNVPDVVIGYVGTYTGKENKLVPDEFKMYRIDIRGLQRKITTENFKSFGKLLKSVKAAEKILEEFKPDIVIGTGGYACWPIIRTASAKGIHTVLHEANSVVGVANKVLLPFVDRFYLNYADAIEQIDKHLRFKCLHVGNPLRDGFATYEKGYSRKELGIDDKYKYVILSCGGSLGAPIINNVSLHVMDKLVRNREDILFMHSTGTGNYDEYIKEFNELGLDKLPNVVVSSFFDDMPLRMAAADISINRAGAMTVSEISMSGKCSIFIPSPHVAENHQYRNAKVLADNGSAFLFEEKDLVDGQPLLDKLSELVNGNNDEVIKDVSEKVKSFAVKDANEIIYNDIIETLKTKRKKNLVLR